MSPRRKIIRHPLADVETSEAVDHYLERSEEAARRFLFELRQTTERIRSAPKLYPKLAGNARHALLHGFPYSVIYRESPDEIQILAIAHGKRRPGYWRKRTF